MCMVDLDGEWWKVERIAYRRARRMHRCNECRRDIEPGELYEYFTGYLDMWTTQKTCAHCVAARGWLSTVCHGWLFDMVLEDLDEHWREHWRPVKSTYLGKLIIGMQRKWMFRGARIPVERVDVWAARGAALALQAVVA